MNPYAGPILIQEEYKVVNHYNAMSGHSWSEQGSLKGYSVIGGGWMRSYHRTLKTAEREVELRKSILAERETRGEL